MSPGSQETESDRTIHSTDLWESYKLRSFFRSALLPALAALLLVGGGIYLALLNSVSLASAAVRLVSSPPGNTAFWSLAGAVTVAAGMILLLVAYADYRDARKQVESMSERYRVEGIATIQAMEKVGSALQRR